MASSFSISTVLLVITFINTVVVTAVPENEYHSMLGALRFRGYNLFANAISTTDLHYDIINGNNFTFFAPIDSALYSLDMSLSAVDYTTVLRFHCVPHRLSLTDLRMLLFGSNSVPTLVPDHEIHVVNPLTLRSPIMVEGVDIALPGLFYGTHIAVHGLEGIMDFRSLRDTINSSTVAANLTQIHTPTTVHREAYAPSPEILVPVDATATPPSIVTAIEAAASPDVSLAHRISVPGAQRYYQPETKSESITQPRPSETKSKSITQPRLPENKLGSIVQPRPPETMSESISKPETYSESVTQPREELVSTATRSELLSRKIKIPDVSLATKSIGKEFTQVGDKIIDCTVTDNIDDGGGEQLNIANVRQGDLYTREVYTPQI
ncbi:hypothetical protein L1987_49082 [Smallanthus sonchifolius]|uniref:Uncharacterized protein n=1 Tax=Smallanthus sonchifolius TaxID=185202 RepID=A0ACB9FTH9_9ASTR|nr:hypothetical protein L1987_49082 [Smallanthus sonchifolius]